MPYGQIHGALATRTEDTSGLIGRIEASFEPTPGLESARAFADTRVEPYPVEYLGVAKGRICFKTGYDDQYEKSESSEAKTVESATYVFQKAKLLVRAYATLDTITKTTQWEESASSDIDKVSVTVRSRTNKTRMFADTKNYRPGVKLVFDVEMCGKAPALDASTRYLTFSWLAGSLRPNPLLFLWAIDPPATTPPAVE